MIFLAKIFIVYGANIIDDHAKVALHNLVYTGAIAQYIMPVEARTNAISFSEKSSRNSPVE